MALITETGAVIAGAESYGTVAEYTTYWTDRAAVPTETTAAIEAALRKATTYIDGKYRDRFKGMRTFPATQALEFPRTGVELVEGLSYHSTYYLTTNSIPLELKQATFEAAKRALSAPLADDLTAGVKREKIDVIETEYFSPIPPAMIYPVIDQLLSRFLKSSSDTLRG